MTEPNNNKIDPARSAEILKEKIPEKRECFRQMSELTLEQTRILEREELEKLEKVVGAKQDLLQRINAIDEEIDPIRQNWDALLLQLPEAIQKNLEAEFLELRIAMEEAIRLEKKWETHVSTQKKLTGGNLDKRIRARRFVKAYGAHTRRPNMGNRFIDKTK